MSGERHFNDPQYKKWRLTVLRRDLFTCQMPGCESHTKLRVHHILKWADYPQLRFNPDNGITLCKRCHDSIWGDEDRWIPLYIQIVAQRNRK